MSRWSYVLLADHLSENPLDFKTLQFMDWVGNRPHGVVLPYNYQSRAEWDTHFAAAGLNVKEWETRIPLYPFPFSAVFGRQLACIGLLEKKVIYAERGCSQYAGSFRGARRSAGGFSASA